MIFCPAIIGLTPPLLLIFLAIIYDPASPYPKARSAPILTIVLSNTSVSNIKFSSRANNFVKKFLGLVVSYKFSIKRASFSSS
jgi:hypothetical protein